MALKKKATTLKQCEDALRATGGFVSQAAKKLGIGQSALSNRIARNKELRDVQNNILESYLDLCESKLISKINKEDLGAICFYLKCKGKHRGYIEKAQFEVSQDRNKPLTWNINIVNPDDDKNKP